MSLNETLVNTLRSLCSSLGAETITVSVSGAAHAVQAMVVDRGVCLLDSQVAGYSGERGRLALAYVVSGDLPALPERGDEVAMLGGVWQLRYCKPLGLAGAGLLLLHCVSEERARLR